MAFGSTEHEIREALDELAHQFNEKHEGANVIFRDIVKWSQGTTNWQVGMEFIGGPWNEELKAAIENIQRKMPYLRG